MKWTCDKIEKFISVKSSKSISLININKKIPGDLFHLEFSNIDLFKNHKDMEYLYILTDKLECYEDNEGVPMSSSFLLKYDGELVDTGLNILDYLE